MIMKSAPAALDAYLKRIGFDGEARPDIATLRALHRLHLEAIPYENLDVQLGRDLSRDVGAAFTKIVRGGRGGWCYEMNGLFAWMLEAIGFRVTRLAGAVHREVAGDRMIGNHLVLIVDLDGPWLADVGLGNGLIEPTRLTPGAIRQDFKAMALEQIEDGWWRFRNHEGALPPSFDFSLDVRDEALLEGQCRWLQTDPGSPFLLNPILQRHFADRVECLVGRTHSVISAAGIATRAIDSEAAYRDVLGRTFGLDLPEARAVWARIGETTAENLLAAM